MGREESVAQSKAAQREKEEAAHAKKQGRKDAVWEKGAKDTSKTDLAAASSADAQARKAAAAAQAAAEEGSWGSNKKEKKKSSDEMTPAEKRVRARCV